MARRILFVLPSFGRNGVLYGAERIAAILMRGAAETGAWEPSLVAFRRPDRANHMQGLDIRSEFLDYRGPDAELRMTAACSLALRRIIADRQPDVVHSHLWPVSFAAGVALMGLPIPHVIHVHDQRPWVRSTALRHSVRRFLHRFVFRVTRPCFVACAEAVARYMGEPLRIPASRIAVVRNGIEIERFCSLDMQTGQELVTVGLAARLVTEKGIDNAIRACAKLRRDNLSITMRVAGGGSDRGEFEHLAADLGIRDRVEFCGEISDMASFFRQVDIALMPSMAEGLPLFVLEAMAAGRPVVATNIAGIPEAVRNGVEGFLVPAGDVDAMADALGRLARSRELRLEMGARARIRARKDFSAERMISECMAVYEAALKAWNSPTDFRVEACGREVECRSN